MTTTTTAIPESHRDMLAAPVVGTLTTVGADGYPQSTAIWFLLDGDVVRTSLLTERQKYKNLVRHPRGTLFLVDPTNHYRTLEVRADVTVDDDPDLAFLGRLLAHYGTDLASFPAPTDGRVVMTFTPHHVVTNG
ncbi:MAG: PPOX class F420-dependent oxidoreductase [Ilumatobacteraceae bacterium]